MNHLSTLRSGLFLIVVGLAAVFFFLFFLLAVPLDWLPSRKGRKTYYKQINKAFDRFDHFTNQHEKWTR